MCLTVTQRAKTVKQPRGGYINIRQFNKEIFDDKRDLNEKENIHSSLVGLTVDYMTRFMVSKDVEKAFEISFTGAFIATEHLGNTFGIGWSAYDEANYLSSCIKGLDDDSIIAACKLVSFDVWYRNIESAFRSKKCDDINPDIYTIENIRIMVERSIKFWEKNGPIVKDDFSFKGGGYTKTVVNGDGDFLTEDTMWDFKVIKSTPNKNYTLQLLMYWIMGKHSNQEIYKNIHKLGIFNPRLNISYTLDTDNISPDIIKEVEDNVICYE